MCGILGLMHLDKSSVEERALRESMRWMQHRGPDDKGVFCDGPIGLAHQRLSILDLTQAGHQPMISADGNCVIVYNGECYNFRQLREDLRGKGCSFRSQSDTEVILQGLAVYGVDFAKQMNGMFALAVWFKDKRQLLLLRDRLGIKPLYYYQDQQRFCFASEIKPLLALGVKAQLQESAVNSFFTLRYVPGEETLFKDIHKLAPGHFLTIDLNGKSQEGVYWDLLSQDSLYPYSMKEAQDKFDSLLDDSIASQQMADVEVGAFLSGGIDSSAIVALMKRNSPKVQTFTFGMGADIDETARATEVAKGLGVNQTIIKLRPDDYRFYEKAVWHLEEPIGDSIIVPTYLLAQQAAQHVKVVLLGEGADEIMGGYVHQGAMTYAHMLKSCIGSKLMSMGGRMAGNLPQSVWERFFPYPARMGKSGMSKVMDYLRVMDKPAKAYLALAGVFSSSQTQGLLNKEIWNADQSLEGRFDAMLSGSRNPDFQNRLLQLDLRYWNADYTLLRMDKLTMAHSLEARVPYLDHRLVELCVRLPRKYKMTFSQQKGLLRRSMGRRGLLPKEIVKAPKKAFYLPIEKCFDKNFESYVRDVLTSQRCKSRGFFKPEALDKYWDRSQRELVGHKQIMLLFIFELWARLYLDGQWKGSNN